MGQEIKCDVCGVWKHEDDYEAIVCTECAERMQAEAVPGSAEANTCASLNAVKPRDFIDIVAVHGLDAARENMPVTWNFSETMQHACDDVLKELNEVRGNLEVALLLRKANTCAPIGKSRAPNPPLCATCKLNMEEEFVRYSDPLQYVYKCPLCGDVCVKEGPTIEERSRPGFYVGEPVVDQEAGRVAIDVGLRPVAPIVDAPDPWWRDGELPHFPTKFQVATIRVDEGVLRESLAAYAHEVWMQIAAANLPYLIYALAQDGHAIDTCECKGCTRVRKHRSLMVPYAHLSEEEKASDRVQADKILAILLGEGETHKEQVVPLEERPCMFEGCRTQSERVDRDYCPACKARMRKREAILRGEG